MLYQHSKEQAQQADLTLNLLLNIFDPGRCGTIPLLCVKTGLVALCGAQLEEKYRFLFTAASATKKTMSKADLNPLDKILSVGDSLLTLILVFLQSHAFVDCKQNRL